MHETSPITICHGKLSRFIYHGKLWRFIYKIPQITIYDSAIEVTRSYLGGGGLLLNPMSASLTAKLLVSPKRRKELISVARFGEISPLWHNYRKSLASFEALFSILQKPVLCIGATFHCCNWSKIEQ